MKDEKEKPLAGQKNGDKTKKKAVKGKNEDFKKKYFDFYDDIKISDRQDW